MNEWVEWDEAGLTRCSAAARTCRTQHDELTCKWIPVEMDSGTMLRESRMERKKENEKRKKRTKRKMERIDQAGFKRIQDQDGLFD